MSAPLPLWAANFRWVQPVRASNGAGIHGKRQQPPDRLTLAGRIRLRASTHVGLGGLAATQCRAQQFNEEAVCYDPPQ